MVARDLFTLDRSASAINSEVKSKWHHRMAYEVALDTTSVTTIVSTFILLPPTPLKIYSGCIKF